MTSMRIDSIIACPFKPCTLHTTFVSVCTATSEQERRVQQERFDQTRQSMNDSKLQNAQLVERVQQLQKEAGELELRRNELESQVKQQMLVCFLVGTRVSRFSIYLAAFNYCIIRWIPYAEHMMGILGHSFLLGYNIFQFFSNNLSNFSSCKLNVKRWILMRNCVSKRSPRKSKH